MNPVLRAKSEKRQRHQPQDDWRRAQDLRVVPTPAVEQHGTAGKIVTIPEDRPRGLVICLMSGFTPGLTGADPVVIALPRNPVTGDRMIFRVQQIRFRMETTGSTSSRILVEISQGSAKFEARTLAGLEVLANEYEETVTQVAQRLKTNDLLRVNVVKIGTSSATWSVLVELGEV